MMAAKNKLQHQYDNPSSNSPLFTPSPGSREAMENKGTRSMVQRRVLAGIHQQLV